MTKDPIKKKLEKERLKLYYINLKTEVLSHYGSVCVCCGESILVFLVIDHINGGGTKQRKDGLPGGSSLYRYLKNNNYPLGYQVLCHNCNWAKYSIGKCPHKG